MAIYLKSLPKNVWRSDAAQKEQAVTTSADAEDEQRMARESNAALYAMKIMTFWNTQGWSNELEHAKKNSLQHQNEIQTMHRIRFICKTWVDP
jgi:hypothetical protein